MVNIRAKIKETLNMIKTCFVDQQPTQSGALVASNDDLLIEILLRLPVTSVLRFKSVCKHWRSLLSDRHFTLLYDNLPKSHGLFVHDMYIPFDVENPSPPPFRSLGFCFDPCGIRSLQSCNGLLLCCSKRSGNDHLSYHDHKRVYYVFNPNTKQFAVIPPVPEDDNVGRTSTSHGMALAFHQKDCAHYKVVCIRLVDFDDLFLFHIQIYSSNTRKWKICTESLSGDISLFSKGFVYWNGAIHWPPTYRNHLYFEIEAEQLQSLPLPAKMTPSAPFTTYFGEYRGHLHLTVIDYCLDTSSLLTVYEMLSDHSGWFVKYQVHREELSGAFPKGTSTYYFDLIDVVRGEKEEDTFMVLKIQKNIIKYNLHHKSFERIFRFRSNMYFEWHEAHRHITTLPYF